MLRKAFRLPEEFRNIAANELPLANGARMLDRRLQWLAFAGGLIGVLCAFKLTRHYAPPSHIAPRGVSTPAPAIELYDQSAPSKIVRLETYLGRQRVLVVFFDGAAGAHSSDVLSYLRDNWQRLRHATIQVIAVSTALPQDNRKDIARYGDFPFPLLSDPDFHVHRDWGRIDAKTAKPLFGLIPVDRKGWVTASAESGKPLVTNDWKSLVESQIAANEI
jgi:peroxiredoxin